MHIFSGRHDKMIKKRYSNIVYYSLGEWNDNRVIPFLKDDTGYQIKSYRTFCYKYFWELYKRLIINTDNTPEITCYMLKLK